MLNFEARGLFLPGWDLIVSIRCWKTCWLMSWTEWSCKRPYIQSSSLHYEILYIWMTCSFRDQNSLVFPAVSEIPLHLNSTHCVLGEKFVDLLSIDTFGPRRMWSILLLNAQETLERSLCNCEAWTRGSEGREEGGRDWHYWQANPACCWRSFSMRVSLSLQFFHSKKSLDQPFD